MKTTLRSSRSRSSRSSPTSPVGPEGRFTSNSENSPSTSRTALPPIRIQRRFIARPLLWEERNAGMYRRFPGRAGGPSGGLVLGVLAPAGGSPPAPEEREAHRARAEQQQCRRLGQVGHPER